jgi:hypothetical protein
MINLYWGYKPVFTDENIKGCLNISRLKLVYLIVWYDHLLEQGEDYYILTGDEVRQFYFYNEQQVNNLPRSLRLWTVHGKQNIKRLIEKRKLVGDFL